MKPPKQNLLLTGTLSVALLSAATMMGQSLGQWDFNSSNLSQSAGANLGDLLYTDPGTASATAFGTTASFGIPAIAGSNAVVMRFPAATNGSGLLMPTPPNANGGGSLVNNWTLIMDVLYPGASDGKIRPIIDTDAAVFNVGPDFIINTGNAIGTPPGGPFNGTILPNTWYRVGIVVTASTLAYYIDGVQVASTPNAAGIDSQFALSLAGSVLIFGTTDTNAALGYLNSLQLRDSALNAGQMSALGAATGGGIPTTIPPVPSFIETRDPAVNATGVSPSPNIHVVLNQGDTTISGGSIQLLLDGATIPGTTVTPSPPTFDITAAVSSILDPNSIHTLTLIWQDNVVGNKTNNWAFTVLAYQNVNLPAPFYFEDFNSLAENATGPGPLPTGWSVTNQTTQDHVGYDINDRDSDAYRDWVLVSSSRFSTWDTERTALPPIVLNGTMLTSLTDGNLMWAESDQRCGGCQGQYQELYTADINCTGRTNVYIAFKSIYEQNQDNMNCVEYSVNQGASWLPVRYLFCTLGNGESSDIYYTNNASSQPVIDVGATFYTVDPNRNWSPDVSPVHSTNYAIYIKAPVSTALIPYIFGYTNDDNLDGKEIIVVRLPQADGQPKVRFRFLADGTSAWFWGIDDLGLYEINTPIVISDPTNVTVSAGGTATFNVAAQSPTPLTYRWQHANTNIFNGPHYSGVSNATLVVSNCDTNEAGQYRCIIGNLYGNINSGIATLTVVTAPQVTKQPSSVVSSIGLPVSLSVSALGRPPLAYQWLKNGSPVGGNSSTLSFATVQLADADKYQVIVTNTEGNAPSRVVRLIVSPPNLSSNLVVHLKFDGNYNDSSGRGNNAAAVAGGSSPDAGPTLVPGKLGQALRFTTKQDGSVFDYATLGYPNDLKFADSSDYSVSFWCNYTSHVDDPPFISNKNWDSSNNRGWGIFTQPNGHFRANVTGTGGTKYDLGSGTTPLVEDGTWHNIVFSYARAFTAAGIVSTYVDGNLVDTREDLTTGSIDTDDLSYSVNVGQDGRGTYTDGGSAGITNALIDDVGIWRRALSAQEALGIYNSGQSGIDLSQAIGAEKLLISLSGGNVIISWPGNPVLKLQKAATLPSGVWADVPGTLGANTVTLPLTNTASYFRLTQ